MDSQDFIYRVKMDNQVIDNMLESDNKRALAMYVFFLRMAKTAPFIMTTIGEMLKFFKLNRGTNQVTTLKSQIKILQLNGLIEVYDSMKLECVMDIDSAQLNSSIYVTPTESISREEFTLVDFDDIDKALFKCTANVETVIATVLLICRYTERRKDIRPIMWFSIDSLSKELHVSKKSFIDISDTMMEEKIIYFKKAEIKKGRKVSSHNIYSLYCDRAHVDDAIEIVKEGGILDRSVKRIHGIHKLSDYAIENKDIINRLNELGYETNSEGAIAYVTQYLSNHSDGSLMSLLDSIRFPAQVTNRTGYVIRALAESSYDNNRYDKIAEMKAKTVAQVENMDVEIKDYAYVKTSGNSTVGRLIDETISNGNKDISDDVIDVLDLIYSS